MRRERPHLGPPSDDSWSALQTRIGTWCSGVNPFSCPWLLGCSARHLEKARVKKEGGSASRPGTRNQEELARGQEQSVQASLHPVFDLEVLITTITCTCLGQESLGQGLRLPSQAHDLKHEDMLMKESKDTSTGPSTSTRDMLMKERPSTCTCNTTHEARELRTCSVSHSRESTCLLTRAHALPTPLPPAHLRGSQARLSGSPSTDAKEPLAFRLGALREAQENSW